MSAEEEDQLVSLANVKMDDDGTIEEDRIQCRLEADFPVVSKEVNYMDVAPNQMASVAASLGFEPPEERGALPQFLQCALTVDSEGGEQETYVCTGLLCHCHHQLGSQISLIVVSFILFLNAVFLRQQRPLQLWPLLGPSPPPQVSVSGSLSGASLSVLLSRT